jgi:hypothetical protein
VLSTNLMESYKDIEPELSMEAEDDETYQIKEKE